MQPNVDRTVDRRARAQEPIVRQVQNRITASQELSVNRAATNPIPDLLSPVRDLSPLTDISEPNMPDIITPLASATAVAAGSSSGSRNIPSVSGGMTASSDNSNARNNPNIPAPSTTRKMPKPGEKNAPVFDPEKPEELGRFFERIEDWYADKGIRDDVDKKRRIVKYLDTDSESQWKALTEFSQGDFENFKKAVMAAYPRAEDVMKGSVSALKKKIKKIGPVEVDERDDLLRLIRIMTAEVLKLKKIQPPIHTNRELVDLFLEGLTPRFANRVAQKLSVHRVIGAQVPNQEARNTEDMFDIEEVMQMAKHTSLENANPYGKYLAGEASDISETSVKLEEAVARLSDSITMQTRYNKQVDQRLANMQTFLSQPRQPVAQPGYNRELAPPNNHVSTTSAPTLCFYCRGLHRIAECEHALQHLDMKWIVKIDGYLRLPNGNSIPREGGKSLKEVVEAANRSKPGIIPMSKIQDKASLYQGNNKAQSFVQVQTPEEEHLRALLEMMQKVGVDRMQEMLNMQTSEPKMDDAEDWNQNFDLAL